MAQKRKQSLKIGSKRYTEADTAEYKSEANKLAKGLREDGFPSVRVIRGGKDGYRILTHGIPKH